MENFNIVIGTHGRFGEELVKSAEMISGPLKNVECCSLLPELSFEDYMHLCQSVLDKKDGFTLVLVDLFGGTPSNVFTALSKKYNHQVITGVNLPLLIDSYLKLNNIDEIDEEQFVIEAIETVIQSSINTNKQL